MKQFSTAGVLVRTSYSSQPCRRVLSALHPCYHLMLVAFSFSGFLVGIKYFYIVALICISLITIKLNSFSFICCLFEYPPLWITSSGFCQFVFQLDCLLLTDVLQVLCVFWLWVLFSSARWWCFLLLWVVC